MSTATVVVKSTWLITTCRSNCSRSWKKRSRTKFTLIHTCALTITKLTTRNRHLMTCVCVPHWNWVWTAISLLIKWKRRATCPPMVTLHHILMAQNWLSRNGLAGARKNVTKKRKNCWLKRVIPQTNRWPSTCCITPPICIKSWRLLPLHCGRKTLV